MNKDSMGKFIERGAVIKRVVEGQITQKAASIQLALSNRQIRRLLRRYILGGHEALMHGNFGKPSGRKLATEMEQRAIEWLKKNGPDFGATFAAEKIAEYLNIKVSVSTMRRWRINNGLVRQQTKKQKQQFVRRPRKEYFGAMLQIDGSKHDWFEGRCGWAVLLTVIDDATGRIHARFAEGESTKDLMILMQTYIEKYGRPHSVYSDHGGPYKVNVGNADGEKMTQLGRALDELDVTLIFANSPQAKGRIERNHAIHQDRLIKEMRLRGISSIDAANEYLQKEYIPRFNQKFGVDPEKTEDVHRSIKDFDLDNIFCIQEKRIVQNDGVIQYQNQLFQVTKNRIYAQPKSEVIVRIHLNGSITLWINSINLGYEIIKKRPIVEHVKIVKNFGRPPVSAASKAWNQGVYIPYKLERI